MFRKEFSKREARSKVGWGGGGGGGGGGGVPQSLQSWKCTSDQVVPLRTCTQQRPISEVVQNGPLQPTSHIAYCTAEYPTSLKKYHANFLG